MNEIDAHYAQRIEALFARHQSIQSAGFTTDAYKPGLERMQEMDALLGHPWQRYDCVHVAGTNGKGSVATLMAAALGRVRGRVGLYTSPHLLDFRERMRVWDGGAVHYPTKAYVLDFLDRWEAEIERLQLSFFEITTALAFSWFRDQQVPCAVIEVGLGGRLDATNIITPRISVITSIGLDHCAILGDSRAQIAGEKAGIIKPGVPVIVGTRDEETAPVFEARAAACHSPLRYADLGAPLPKRQISALAKGLDLRGDYQKENLATALTALEILLGTVPPEALAAMQTAGRSLDFRGRWDRVSEHPDILCDIGHNPPALAANLRQLRREMRSGRYTDLTMILGMMADKDVSGLLHRIPRGARLILTGASTPRALSAEELQQRMQRCGIPAANATLTGSVAQALDLARKGAAPGTLIYVGGSAYVVSDAFKALGVRTGPED